ncbi:MerR family transcriptional regulator [Lactobacillus sp. S2-2]|uniref:MerR family transcriptional regulator n=1 Tax=Lactobacillus sp. S2-2 TaxID=2692917 RepID=UPI001F304B78|nr:MerR family transcriptional regulator [Lactobacillus sp. S2-2]MCF6515261.1 MerR family transcriptional regulator [Lactobacillus sp. S2-2]
MVKPVKHLYSSPNFKKLVFRIGEVSEITGVSTRQIRYWDEKGLIESTRKETEKTNSRVFDFKNLILINLINMYLQQGFTLAAAFERAQKRQNSIKRIHSVFNTFDNVIVDDEDVLVIDLGYFDDEKTKHLFGIIDENTELHYQVKEDGQEPDLTAYKKS